MLLELAAVCYVKYLNLMAYPTQTEFTTAEFPANILLLASSLTPIPSTNEICKKKKKVGNKIHWKPNA